MPEHRFTRDHVLTRNAYTVDTNIGGYLSLDYDGISHPVNLNTKLPDGSAAFPPIESLVSGTVIRATYSLPLGADPLVTSLVPKLISIQIVGTAPVYEVVVQTVASNSRELEDQNYVTSRLQTALQGQATVVGIRRLV